MTTHSFSMTDKKYPETLHGEVKISEFKAPFWARNRHVQTIFPRFFQSRKPFAYRQERLDLPDGDFVNVIWGESQQVEPKKGLAVIFHGLEGSIKSHYANDLMAELQNSGWQAVMMHFRGCGGEANRTTRAYHSGETEDATYFLEWLGKRFPELPKVAIGFSLGANMLLKLLGENPKQRLIKAAVAISAPLKLNECAKSINQGFSKNYQKYLLNSMTRNLVEKMRNLDYSAQLKVNAAQVLNFKNFMQFDEHVTAPLHGFKNAADYYQRCSAFSFLRHILTPTLVLHSLDDPFMNPKVVPAAKDLSSSVTVELSSTGGHVGFMQGTPWRPQIWFHQRVISYINDFKRKI